MLNRFTLIIILTCVTCVNVFACMNSQINEIQTDAKLANNLIKNICFESALRMKDLESDYATSRGTELTTCHDKKTEQYTLFKLKNCDFYAPGQSVTSLIYIPRGFAETFKNLLSNILAVKNNYRWAQKDIDSKSYDRMITKLNRNHQSIFSEWTYKGTESQEFITPDKVDRILPLTVLFNPNLKISVLLTILEP